ncbi:39s ribosomal protein [Dirofilaria immitis]|nr:39s ribosomal protein [Dirofilaria immitis]
MKQAPRSIYADIFVKEAHRVKRTPRVARPWRPKVIAWAGPAAFYRNRFYEPNAWYKARITKPVLYPKMHVIDPDNHLLSLKDRLAEKNLPPIPSLPSPENISDLSRKVQCNKPDISIESLGDGFNSFVLLNLDGNPYNCDGEIIHCASMMDRIFTVGQLYKEFENQWTPSAISFAQASWDVSVNEAFHRIGMKSPIYEYQYNPPVKMDQKEFPLKPQPFNLYLDQFRDPKEVNADLLKRRLQMREIDKNPEQPKYPDIDYAEHKKNIPFWQHDNLLKENSGSGRYKALWNNPIN